MIGHGGHPRSAEGGLTADARAVLVVVLEVRGDAGRLHAYRLRFDPLPFRERIRYRALLHQKGRNYGAVRLQRAPKPPTKSFGYLWTRSPSFNLTINVDITIPPLWTRVSLEQRLKVIVKIAT